MHMSEKKCAHSLREWLFVTRFWSFAVSSMPVIVTFCYLLSLGMVPSGAAPYVNAVLALVGVVILHAAGNVLSDWADYKSGVDNEEAFAVPNLVFGKFKPREYLVFSLILFVLGCATGLVLTIRCGLELLLIGGAGVLLTVLYSPLKFNALGDLDIFIIFSVLIMLGTGFVVTGEVCPQVLVLALPVGIITVSVLHANNTFDIESDGKAGIRTFAMLLGGRVSSKLYMAYMAVPFVSVAVAVAAGWVHPFALLCFAAAPMAIKNARAASHFNTLGIGTMQGLDQGSAAMQTVFSGALSVGLVAAALI